MSKPSRSALTTTAVAAALTIAPAIADACPSCVGNTQYANTQLLMLAGFTLLPFTLVATVGFLVWRAGRDDR